MNKVDELKELYDKYTKDNSKPIIYNNVMLENGTWRYHHIQNTPSNIWNITHNLNSRNVQLHLRNNESQHQHQYISYEIISSSLNSIVIQLENEMAGYAEVCL